MDRDIKFKAWCGQEKEMYHVEVFPCGQDTDIGEVKEFTNDEDSIHVHFETLKILQYTGMKDRNGKEIYEGDIWKRDLFISKVVFEYSGWAFTKLPSSGCYQYPSFYSNADSGEIIGNIHENPELLEEVK